MKSSKSNITAFYEEIVFGDFYIESTVDWKQVTQDWQADVTDSLECLTDFQ